MVSGASKGTRYEITTPFATPLTGSLLVVPGRGSVELLKYLRAIGCVSGTSEVSK
jgi:hypothetical protein